MKVEDQDGVLVFHFHLLHSCLVLSKSSVMLLFTSDVGCFLSFFTVLHAPLKFVWFTNMDGTNGGLVVHFVTQQLFLFLSHENLEKPVLTLMSQKSSS